MASPPNRPTSSPGDRRLRTLGSPRFLQTPVMSLRPSMFEEAKLGSAIIIPELSAAESGFVIVSHPPICRQMWSMALHE